MRAREKFLRIANTFLEARLNFFSLPSFSFFGSPCSNFHFSRMLMTIQCREIDRYLITYKIDQTLFGTNYYSIENEFILMRKL